jgi:hypothetical protein
VQWLIADQLGTHRMVFDKSGDLDKMIRHDYLPFGEELFEPIGGRSAGQSYTQAATAWASGSRQKSGIMREDVKRVEDKRRQMLLNEGVITNVEGEKISEWAVSVADLGSFLSN